MKNIDGYVRDKNNTGAVLNTDNAALEAYKRQKAKHKNLENKLNEIDEIKKDVTDIKNMLSLIIEKIK